MIVVSILLTSAIDAWCDGPQEREAEGPDLGGLQIDFPGHLERLEEVRARNPGRIAAGEVLLASAGIPPMADGILLPSRAELEAGGGQ